MKMKRSRSCVFLLVCAFLFLVPSFALASLTGGIEQESAAVEQVEQSEEAAVADDPALVEQVEEVQQFGESQAQTNQTEQDKTATTSATNARIFTFDEHGNELDLVTTKAGNFLFLTNQTNRASLTLHVLDGIASTDTGVISEDIQSLTADLSSTDHLTITTQTGQTLLIQIMQSNLPCLYVGLSETTIEEIHRNKTIKHPNNSVVLSDLEDLSHELDVSSVQIKGRGNTSWQWYEKRGYQLKFAKRTNVLDMGAAKKWVLLASANDPSLMRYKLGLDLSARLSSWYVPEARYVDLWIAGDYRGTYLISEKVEIDKERVALGTTGVLAELDNEFYTGETFDLDRWERHFVLKDPDALDVGNNFALFMNKLRSFEKLLEEGASWSELASLADLESIARLYLVNEFLSNNEVTVTSQFWYTDGPDDVLHAGPVWDFDSWASPSNNPFEYYCYLDRIFTLLENYPQYRAYVAKLWNSGVFQQTLSDVDAYESLLSNSAAMNYSRWDSLGTTDRKGFGFANSYAACVSNLRSWLTIRMENFKPNAQLIYRVYNPNSGEHFYTHGKSERNRLVGLGWQAEGIAWVAPIVSSHPVYRLYNPNAGDHHYSLSPLERDTLMRLGWNYEGIGWYSDEAKRVALLRVYNPNAIAGAHHFTTSQEERNFLVGLGWRAEGIGWYGL